MIEMAESKGALIAKSVQKHAGRAKEKVFMVYCTNCMFWVSVKVSLFWEALGAEELWKLTLGLSRRVKFLRPRQPVSVWPQFHLLLLISVQVKATCISRRFLFTCRSSWFVSDTHLKSGTRASFPGLYLCLFIV